MTLDLKVSSIACSGCIDTITKAIHEIDSTAIVNGDTQTKLVKIETNQSQDAIVSAITAVGHSVE
jgi:copper chaperone